MHNKSQYPNIIKTAVLSLFLVLAGCNNRKSLFNKSAKESLHAPKNLHSFNLLMHQFAHNIESLWGISEILVAGPKDYVKYHDLYQTRSHINFEQGTIVIESINKSAPQQAIKHAIISTLLMSSDPTEIALYDNNDDIHTHGVPLLHSQVLDQQGKAITNIQQANNYAHELLKKALQKRQTGNLTIWYLSIPLQAGHLGKRAYQYTAHVMHAAKQYRINPALVFAIIEVESSFNPYAISPTRALGLMQVQQHTAGKDVFLLKGYRNTPSRDYLFDPQNNINTGTAYLHLLEKRYLAKINHQKTRYYAMIAAYNCGAGSLLRLFAKNQEAAFSRINHMRPQAFFNFLTTKHPSRETREYLKKVINTEKKYYAFKQ